MRDRNFIESERWFSFFRLSLFRVLKKSRRDNPLFRHIWTGQLWERYEFDTIEHLRITGYGYRKYPLLETSELIDIALNSNLDEEIIGACRLLFELEFEGIEFREELINRMERNIKKISKKRFSLIYERANLINQGNLREIMNKTDKEINADLAFYQGLYRRTLELKEKITAANIV